MRYFTDEELLKESRPLADLALEALDAGQIQQLHCLLNEMDQGHAGLCVLGLEWMTRMWGKIRADFGEEVLDGMLGKSAAYLMEPYVKEFLAGDEKGGLYTDHPDVDVPARRERGSPWSVWPPVARAERRCSQDGPSLFL